MDKDHEKIVMKRNSDDDRLVHINLDNLENRNVLDLEMISEINDALLRSDLDDSVQGIILGTTGDVFCAGADVSELKDLTFEEGSRWLEAYYGLVNMLKDTGKPTVAAVRGACVAGGNELMMGCDLAVAGESARFGQPEAGIGSTAAGGGVQILPLIVGMKRAKELLLTGEIISAKKAEEFGLINKVVPDESVEAEVVNLVQSIIDEKSPQAYRVIKSIMEQWDNLAMLNWPLAREMTSKVWTSEEFSERAETFLSKRKQEPQKFLGVLPESADEKIQEK